MNYILIGIVTIVLILLCTPNIENFFGSIANKPWKYWRRYEWSSKSPWRHWKKYNWGTNSPWRHWRTRRWGRRGPWSTSGNGHPYRPFWFSYVT